MGGWVGGWVGRGGLYLAHGEVEGEVKGQNHPRQQNDKHRESRVFKVGQLDLH